MIYVEIERMRNKRQLLRFWTKGSVACYAYHSVKVTAAEICRLRILLCRQTRHNHVGGSTSLRTIGGIIIIAIVWYHDGLPSFVRAGYMFASGLGRGRKA